MAYAYAERFLDPFLIGSLRGGATVPATAEMRDGKLVAKPDGHGLPQRLEGSICEGEKLRGAFAWEGRDIVFLTETELAEREGAARQRREEAEKRAAQEWQEAAERRVHRAAEAEVFNAALRIPVPWHLAHRIVLSGLTARSAGDGANTATVWHVALDQPLVAGRLRRAAGDLLCSPDHGSFGTSGSGGEVARATCRACLRIAARFAVRG